MPHADVLTVEGELRCGREHLHSIREVIVGPWEQFEVGHPGDVLVFLYQPYPDPGYANLRLRVEDARRLAQALVKAAEEEPRSADDEPDSD